MGKLSLLTPTERTKVENQLFSDGYYQQEPPAWFVDQIQNQMKQSITKSKLKELWEAYRQPIIGQSNGGSTSTQSSDYGYLNIPSPIQ